MTVTLLSVQALLCIILLYNELLVKKASNFATSVFYLIYAVVYVTVPLILHIFFGGARSIVAGVTETFIGDEIASMFNVYGILFLAVALAISVSGRPTRPHGFEPRRSWLYDTYVAGFIVLGLLLFLYSAQMSIAELLITTRFSWTTSDPLRIVLGAASVYLIAFTPFYFYRFNTSARGGWITLAICLGAVLLYGAVTRDRKWIFYLVSGWLAALYDKSGRRLDLGPQHAVFAGILLFVLFATNYARDIVPRYLGGEDVDLLPYFKTWFSDTLQFGDLSYFYRASLEALHQNVDEGFLIPLALLRRIAFFFLPTSYSGGLKVEDIAATFSDVVGGEDALRRGNMPPGLFGLSFISFGATASLFIIPAFALLIAWLDRFLRTQDGLFRDVLLSLYLTCVVFAFRGDESSAFYLPVVNYFMLLLILQAARIRLRPRLI